MRIVGGERRGLKLAEVGDGDPAAHLRPTPDRVREAVFNLLTNGPAGDRVRGQRVLDLFAGTGALGLEALSRGAAQAIFVDDGRVAQALIRRNIALMRAEAAADLLRLDATRLGPNGGAPFALVFLDPPYGQSLGERALASALEGGWLAPGACVVWEEAADPAPPPGFAVTDRRRYGGTSVTLLQGHGGAG
ncbi:MAG: 16S rRNA (guanine(966)-N(2))-methyltransferase RsmD [Paracoccaceae bacterium]